jgi:hypothetical protein
MVNNTEENKSITWLRCCELSAELNFNQYTGRTIMKWYLQLHKRRDNKKVSVLKWMRSSSGRLSRSAKSPFSEDESLMVQFKSWARSDLETLTVNKAQAWVNKILLKDWSAEDLDNSKILYPVSHNIAARWMLEAEFTSLLEKHEITSLLTPILLHCQMVRMPLQLRVALNTSRSCSNIIVQPVMLIISS